MLNTFQSAITGYRNGYIQAKLLTTYEEFDRYASAKWSLDRPLKSLQRQMPVFKFEVRGDVPHPDNYWTGTQLDLYSGRLLALLESFGGFRFETFPAEIYERKSARRVLEDYRVFRLLETYPVISLEASIVLKEDNRTRIEKLVIDEKAADCAPPLCADESFKQYVFINDALKNALEKQGISGCQIKSLEESVNRLKSTYARNKMNPSN